MIDFQMARPITSPLSLRPSYPSMLIEAFVSSIIIRRNTIKNVYRHQHHARDDNHMPENRPSPAWSQNAKANYIGVERCCLPGSGLIRVVSTNPGYVSAKSGPSDQLLRFRMWRSKTGLMISSSESPADSKQSVAS